MPDPVPDPDPIPCPTIDVIPRVGAVVHDGRRHLLVVQRGHEPGRGRWSVPGGRVEPGETDEAAVRREVAEETGLAIQLVRRLGSVRRPAPGGSTYDIADYLARPVIEPAPDPQPGDDADAARWVTRAELAGLPVVDGLVAALTEWSVLPD